MAVLINSTGTITAAAGVVNLAISGAPFNTVVVSGTYAGAVLVFEGSSNGTTYYPITAYRTNNGVADTNSIDLTLPSNATRGWYLCTAGLSNLRVRASSLSSGTVSVASNSGPDDFPVTLTVGFHSLNTGKTNVALAAGSGAANAVLVATGPGILHRLVVTTAGATAGLIIYDNATTNSGTILYTSAATFALGTIVELNLPFANGLTVRQAATTAAATLSYTLL